MRTFVCCVVAAVCCGAGLTVNHAPGVAVGTAAGAQADGAAMLTDWLTDGGDNQRTGWNRNEKILTKDNVKNLKLLWKIRDRQPGPGAAFADAGAGRRPAEHAERTASRSAIVNGISDNLYAFDVEAGKILWQKHWDYAAPAAGGGPPASANPDPAHLGFLRPGGSSDTPVIGPRRRAGPPADATSSPATGCCTS